MTHAPQWTDEQWQAPPSLYRSAPFWAWNDLLEPDRLCRQIRQMHEAGMGGFFMHSRYGLKTEYLSDRWFECVSACVEKARELDMKAYLYDEDRWPSGAAGGLVTREDDSLAIHRLVALTAAEPPKACEIVAAFAVAFDPAGSVLAYRALAAGEAPAPGQTLVNFLVAPAAPTPWHNDAPYLDVMDRRAVAEFIRLTHQAYADRYGKDFGGVIPAVFTDEPNYSHRRLAGLEEVAATLQWTAELPLEFRKRRGYDFRDRLPELFFPLAAGAFSKVRYDYHRTTMELYVENFSRQVGRWCGMHNIAATGHYNAEGPHAAQINNLGAAMPHYAHQQWPGIDILTDRRLELVTVKQCSSVADQLGRERVLSELYGCTGWDWPLEGHKFNAGWQYVLGVNFRCPHLSWYSAAGGAKRDYPASIFPHSPWWKHYRVVEDCFARLSLMLTRGAPVRDVLMLHSVESGWGTFLPGRGELLEELEKPFHALLAGLLDHHYDYDLGDESLLAEHARAAGGKLTVGRMEYRLVVVPPSITLRGTTVALLKRLVDGGGRVLFVGRPPELVDGERRADLAALVAACDRCDADVPAVAAAIQRRLPRRVSVTEGAAELPCVWTMLRQVKGGQLLFLHSNDRQDGHEVRVSLPGRGPVVLWDALTGRRYALAGRPAGDRIECDLSLPPTGSALLSLGLKVDARPLPAAAVAAAADAPGPWKIELLEHNTFPLDFARWRVGGEAFSEPAPVLLAEEKIRGRYGLPPRSNSGQQPWYLARTGRFDRTERGRAELKFAFHVTDVPAALKLAIERPGDFEISLNGRAVASKPDGWWVDEDIKTVDLAAAVRAGDNELLLKFDYRSDMEIEDLHLVGGFGVRQRGEKRQAGAYTLVSPPAELSAGSWVGQGLDFYGGGVKYVLPVPPSAAAAAAAGKRVRLALPGIRCTCAAIEVQVPRASRPREGRGGEERGRDARGTSIVLPWPPMSADVTDALAGGAEEVAVEVIGGRKNILGPLHVPWLPWTGPNEFDPHHKQWTDQYLLTDHGLMAPPVFETLG